MFELELISETISLFLTIELCLLFTLHGLQAILKYTKTEFYHSTRFHLPLKIASQSTYQNHLTSYSPLSPKLYTRVIKRKEGNEDDNEHGFLLIPS